MTDPIEIPPAHSVRKQIMFRVFSLLVTAITLYLVFPSLLDVLSEWDSVSQLSWWWLLLAALSQTIAFSFVWALQRLVLRTDAWLPVVTSQLAGNAAGRLIPGGGATGATVQFRMLRTAGVSTGSATSGLAAAGLLQLGTTLALPLAALPSVLFGAPVPENLVHAAWLGAVLFVILLLLVVAAFADDRALTWVGRVIDAVKRRSSNAAPRVHPTSVGLLAERDALIKQLGDHWLRAAVYSVGRAGFDYLTLLIAIAAFGADARPSLVLLAYASAALLGMIPITPGGLGFVEAGLTATLVLAGVSPGDAVSVALLYRLMSFWLPIPAGLISGVVHKIRYGRSMENVSAG